MEKVMICCILHVYATISLFTTRLFFVFSSILMLMPVPKFKSEHRIHRINMEDFSQDTANIITPQTSISDLNNDL